MDGRRILITGTSRGIGAYLARHYVNEGDYVLGCARGPAALEHDRYTHVSLDVTDESAVHELFRTARTRFGRLDVLVNNAGVATMNAVALTPFITARRVLETNFLGTFLFSHRAIRLLRHSSAGRIVNLTTVAVPWRLDGEAIYAAAKSAVETFTRILAKEVGSYGITVNAVGPCPVRTELTAGVPAPKLQALIERQAVPRWAEPTDVANVIDFFLRPESALVTGQVIYLGGVS